MLFSNTRISDFAVIGIVSYIFSLSEVSVFLLFIIQRQCILCVAHF